MGWVKIDDQFAGHPKVTAAGPQAGWLFVAGLCYAGQHLTDGFIPSSALPLIYGTKRLAERLVSAGMWETAEGGYIIHDYLVYQPTKAKVLAERDAAKQRMFGRRSGEHGAKSGRTSPAPVPDPDPVDLIDPPDRGDHHQSSHPIVVQGRDGL